MLDRGLDGWHRRARRDLLIGLALPEPEEKPRHQQHQQQTAARETTEYEEAPEEHV
jgi:hypothetical protein